MPGGALVAVRAGALDGVSRIFCLHCDPGIDVGQLGLREGPLTGAADSLDVRLTGKGGHTSRPHLTEDLTFALGKLVTELPAVLSRRLDPRAGVSVVWGLVRSGSAMNVIPAVGRAAGTVRMLDAVAWADAEHLVRETVGQIVEAVRRGARGDLRPRRPAGDQRPRLHGAPRPGDRGRAWGRSGHISTTQSLGGEDFAWFLEHVPGAMARLGTRTPGGPTYDLHQGDLRVDEDAVPIAAKVLVAAAVQALINS